MAFISNKPINTDVPFAYINVGLPTKYVETGEPGTPKKIGVLALVPTNKLHTDILKKIVADGDAALERIKDALVLSYVPNNTKEIELDI